MAKSLSLLRSTRTDLRPDEPRASAPNTEPQPEGEPMHEALDKMHENDPSSKHMIVSHDGYSAHSAGIDEDGKHEPESGAHDHENLEALKDHMGKFFDEEEDEGKKGDEDGEEPEENQSLY